MTTQEQNQKTEIATAQPAKPNPKDEILNGTMTQIHRHISEGKLHLPANYSVENALQSAWLILQDTKDRNGKKALEVCTMHSIINALRNMAIMGLDPARKQCYLIVRGDQLCCDRSYFGDLMVAQRVRPDLRFFADVIYDSEEIQITKQFAPAGFLTTITGHDMTFPREGEIKGAYCGAMDSDGKPGISLTVMTITEIHTSWKKSKTYGKTDSNGNIIPSFHTEQPDQACLRTVIRRATKSIINTSTDELLLSAIAESEIDSIDVDAKEVAANANSESFEEAVLNREVDAEVQTEEVEAVQPKGDVESAPSSPIPDSKPEGLNW